MTVKGIGSRYTAFMTQAGPNMVWTISLIAQTFTSVNEDERNNLLNMIVQTGKIDLVNKAGPTPYSIAPIQSVGLIHESVWIEDHNFYTRGSFGLTNAYFAELILSNKIEIF